MIPKRKRKTLKQNDPLNFEDIVDRGDLSMLVKEQWWTQHTVKTLTTLAKKHPGQPWSIFRIEDQSLYVFDQESHE